MPTEAYAAIPPREGLNNASIRTYYRNLADDIASKIRLMSRLRQSRNVVTYEEHQIVPRQDYGYDIYIRMELLTSLPSYLDRYALSRTRVVSLGLDLCGALAACAQYHILHRDIKPDNLFVAADGTFKLGDFGIARQLERVSAAQRGAHLHQHPPHAGNPAGVFELFRAVRGRHGEHIKGAPLSVAVIRPRPR